MTVNLMPAKKLWGWVPLVTELQSGCRIDHVAGSIGLVNSIIEAVPFPEVFHKMP